MAGRQERFAVYRPVHDMTNNNHEISFTPASVVSLNASTRLKIIKHRYQSVYGFDLQTLLRSLNAFKMVTRTIARQTGTHCADG
jgi:hypothetical protein